MHEQGDGTCIGKRAKTIDGGDSVMSVLEVWLEIDTDQELLGLVPDDKPERIYEIVRGYEKGLYDTDCVRSRY